MFRFNLSFLKIKKRPSFRQWLYFFKVLSKKELYGFLIFFVLAFFSLSFIVSGFYYKNTKIAPANGGIFVEGALGQPRFINPVYANSDADRDLTQLVFSGLMKYNENLEVVPDLAEKYEIKDEGKTYIFYLKENIFWQDKTPIEADDVLFTIKTIQDPEYKSPQRASWVGVLAEKINDTTVKLSIKQPYNSFLENCALKIIPSHIWKDIPPQNFPLELYNLKPIGSGPYKVKEIKQDNKNHINSIILVANPLYHGKLPYITEINFLFFNEEEELIREAKNGKLSGFSTALYSEIKNKNPWNARNLLFPRYFAVFFNPEKSKILSDLNIRMALNYATDKKEIAKNVLTINGSESPEKKIVESPILPDIYGFNSPSVIYDFNIEKAKELLNKAGYEDPGNNQIREKTIKKELSFQFRSDLKLNSQGTEVKELQKCLVKFPDIYPEGETSGNFGKKTEEAVIRFQEKYADEILKPGGFKEGTGMVSKATRNKLNDICFDKTPEKSLLKISLATVDQKELLEVANLLKEQWKKAGVEVEIINLPISKLEQDYIKPRNYDGLIFGEVLGSMPDLLPFWHSSQKRDPGLNLAVYDNKNADKLLEEIRKSLDQAARKEKLNAFQNILIKDAPAIFLYCPDYIYFTSKEVQNIKVSKIVDPSKRFVGIEDWFIKTKRVWK